MQRPLIDGFGRIHRDLRISITDRCNYRCTYCMPEEGLRWLPREEVLSFEEIERLARILVERFGIDSIRLTGGEPTVRAHLPALVEKLSSLGTDLTLTTNGSSLGLLAGDLASAGLRRINISLDSLRPARFLELTRRDDLQRVLDGIAAAVAAGLHPVKVNVVVMRGINDDEVLEMAAFGRTQGVLVRFIEFMPLDGDDDWSSDKVVPGAEIVAAIDAVFPLEAVAQGHDPAERWRYRDGGGEVGVIASVTEPFCASCDRIRLTADGRLRACLFSTEETDLRGLLRSGSDDATIAAAMALTVAGKWAGHQIGQPAFIRPRRSMSQIGG
ncbi:MAG: GTP 3',8-cyclase MoaA [Acidimicrobiales bacterium]